MAKGLGNIMKQAQQMQAKIARVQQELELKEIEVTSGGGMVTARVNGKLQFMDIDMDAFYLDIRDNSKDNGIRLLVYYLSHHRRKVDEVMSECVPEIMTGIREIELQNYICPTDCPVISIMNKAWLVQKSKGNLYLLYLRGMPVQIVKRWKIQFGRILKCKKCWLKNMC